MKTLPACVLALALAASGLRAEEAPNPAWGKAADNAIYAQKLVNELMAAHPELVVVGIHPVAPGARTGIMLATNLDRIGKADDDDDLGCATERKTVLAPNLSDPAKFEVLIPLKDASGQVIGALGLVFRFHGQKERELYDDAVSIRDGLAKRIPNLAALSRPTPL
jgi:hypothetical protein